MPPLEELIRARILENGPMPVAEYMELCLGHPQHGYYMKGDPFGVEGDFITAPEISQVFGELIGLWAAVTWQQMGEPEKIMLIECGPGRGTLMRDLLRAAELVPGFANAIELHLIETSPAMRDRQRVTLSASSPVWHDTLDTVPPGPAILVANEFLDALPIRQFVRTGGLWAERCVGLDGEQLVFMAGTAVTDISAPDGDTPVADGQIFETCPAALEFADALNNRLNSAQGAALFIDYGHVRSAPGDTLQAVHGHMYANPLTKPGYADLTAHVDFEAFGKRLGSGGARLMGPVTQREFLTNLGIGPRTDRLAENASAANAQEIREATERLIASDQMGDLFKVMVAADRQSPTLAGFES